MKCVLCSQRKGKRFCPALGTSICPVCCGEKRVVEISCPPDCEHLVSGQSHQMLRKFVGQLTRENDPHRKRRLYEITNALGPFLARIEEDIVRFASGVRALRDREAAEAVELLRKTYETEQKGIIFEHRSPNPLVQSLIRDLGELLEKMRSDPEEGFPRLTTRQIIDCLEVTGMNIQYHLEMNSGENAYLDFVKRNHPGAMSKGSRGGLLAPG